MIVAWALWLSVKMVILFYFFQAHMSSAEFQALSQDELRKRLYQTFKNRGVLDALKVFNLN